MSLIEDGEIVDPFRSFIAKSRYSRWIEEYGRRESWEETVNRYVDFISAKADLTPDEKYHLRYNVLNHKVMPSMRLLMTAGEAAERSNLAIYNCSFVSVNDLRVFDEALYILMNGTGLGFGVEKSEVDLLPSIPAEIKPSEEIIVVEDSKEGWAQSYRELVACLYRGELPKWDLRRLRPEGSRLKTFGGRSSGPEPLNELFEFTVKIIAGARGRKLKPIECHEIMCKIGAVVVVGGVRRSALISLSDLSDEEVRDAKSGEWWVDRPHLALSNNSAVYHRKPTRATFDAEWAALVASGSGERGIFNIAGAKASSPSRRNKPKLRGTNPCLTGDTWVITSDGPRQIENIIGQKTNLLLDGKLYDSTGFFYTGTKPVYKLTLDNGMSLKATDNHQIMTLDGWKELKDITIQDSIRLSNNQDHSWSGEGNFSEGYLVGLLVGDGTFGVNACIDVWESSESILKEAQKALDDLGITHNFNLCTTVGNDKKWRATGSQLTKLASRFGVVKGNKIVTTQIQESSHEFYRGFLRGYFDADGSVQGNRDKGQSVRLTSVSKKNLCGVQSMLSRLGIKSKVFFDRREEGIRMLPNSDREMAPYFCKSIHELIISKKSIEYFAKIINFGEINKAEKLNDMLFGKRNLYNDSLYSKVSSIIFDGIEDVYDATVPETSAFDANGLYVHNCAEIVLRSAGLCNLTEVIVREDDSLEDLKAKVSLAAKMGTWQATLTNFPYLRDIWRQNAEEESLLGVSMTGVMGHKILNGRSGREDQIKWLSELKRVAVLTNRREARRLGINPAAAVTCNKPSGTVSTLTNTSSGLHAWHDKYFIRRVRVSKTDPIGQFLQNSGIPCETDFYNDKSWVFSFPFAAPEGAVTRNDMTAIDQLENWLVYKTYWTEHSPSVTVSVRDEEWEEVGNWVFEHFDLITGVSFLPYSDHTYEQAPFESCSRETYEAVKSSMPNEFEWYMLPVYESYDQTVGMSTLACQSGVCDVVDLVKESV